MNRASVAQPEERPICNRRVTGSKPVAGSKPKPNFSWDAIDALLKDEPLDAKPPIGAFTIHQFIADLKKRKGYVMPFQTAVNKLARWAKQGKLHTGQFNAPDLRGRKRMTRMYWK
jgi:hypothetical protein